MGKKKVVKKVAKAGSKTGTNAKAASKPRQATKGSAPVGKKVRRKTKAVPKAPAPAPKAPLDWKKVLRPIFYIVFIAGCLWYYSTFKAKAKGRKDFSEAVEMINKNEDRKAMELLEDIKSRNLEDPPLLEKVDNHLARTYVSVSRELMQQKKWEEALKLLLKVLDLSPETVRQQRVYYSLGECYRNLEQTATALEYMKEALAKNPNNRAAKLKISEYEARLKAVPLFKKGKMALNKENYRDARSYFKELADNYKLFRQVPDSYPWYHLSLCAMHMGQGEEACMWLEKSEKEQKHEKDLRLKHENLRRELQNKFPEAYKKIDPEEKKKIFEEG